jgi:hypothetical protein
MATDIVANRKKRRGQPVPEGFADTSRPVYGMQGRRFDPQKGIR